MDRSIVFRSVGLLVVLMLTMGCTPNNAQTSQIQTTSSSQKPSLSKATVISTPALASTPTASNPAASSSRVHPVVFMILMENHNWSDISANPAAPYINNTLLPMSSYARSYYNPPGLHPSEPNYLWLEAGTNFGIFDDSSPALNHQSTSMHLVTLLNRAHISWKSYQEDISGTICPLNTSGFYAVKHNPTVFFDDVTGTNNPQSTFCIAHERPYTEFAADLRRNTVTLYNFITPNICNDMHDSCAPSYNAVQQGDSWLARQIPPILASQAYKNGGVIFITWDEGEGGDGPIGMIVLSSYAKGKGYSNSIHYTHSSTLRTVEEIFSITPLLGDAAKATDLADLFLRFPHAVN